MAAFEHNEKEEEEEEEFEPEKTMKLVKVPTTLASIESLTFPLVQEVVLLADYRCTRCRDRVADIVSKLNGRIESIEIMAIEKKVILTFTRKYPKATPTREKKPEVVAIYKNIVNKIPYVKQFLRSPNT